MLVSIWARFAMTCDHTADGLPGGGGWCAVMQGDMAWSQAGEDGVESAGKVPSVVSRHLLHHLKKASFIDSAA